MSKKNIEKKKKYLLKDNQYNKINHEKYKIGIYLLKETKNHNNINNYFSIIYN
jgi:hypothetical protein